MVRGKKRWVAGLISGITVCVMITAGFLVFRHAAAASPAVQVVDPSSLHATTTTIGGGADVLPTTRTIPHWHGTAVNPNDGITYGFNMVGADPNNCSGADCSTTIEADITPIIVHFQGFTFDGTQVLGPTLASPVFATNDYGSTPSASTLDPNNPNFEPLGPGGVLSQGDAGVPLQLEDATMRAQFNKTGAGSNYHVILHPNIMPALTINVPDNQGELLETLQGLIFPSISINWWAAQISNLETQADPTHLPIYLTDDVMLFLGHDPLNCCVIGFHGNKATGHGNGRDKSNGDAKVQTFAWASWVRPSIFQAVLPNGTQVGVAALLDIQALSHEIAEWADDPFVNNTVEGWTTGGLPCSTLLETGDPVVGTGFAMGTNTFDQGPLGGVQFADGFYHPEDEAFLPWFMRTEPNTISEPTQAPSANGGRYTLMGSLNPFSDFTHGAPAC
jgi:hypothetical protein